MTLSRSLDRLLFLLLCLTSFVHIFVFDEAVFPYITSKNFLFRLMVQFAFGIWLALIFLYRRYEIHFSKILTSLIVFMSVIFLSNILGVYFKNSFWSNYERMEGYISLIYYFIFFLLLATVLNSPQRWFYYLLSHLAASCIIFIVVLLQLLNVVAAVAPTRVDGTFGNPTYLGAFSVVSFFMSVHLYLQKPRRGFKIFLFFAAFANLFDLYVSQTRSATFAFVAGLFMLVFLSAKNKLKTFGLTVLVIGVLGVSLYFFKSRLAEGPSLLKRLSDISSQDHSTQARLQIWDYCWQAIQARPLLGYGQDNFSYLAEFYNPGLWSSPWVDRAHNLILDWLVTTGIVGTISLLILIACALIAAIRSQQKVLIAFLTVWFVNNLFAFDFLSTSILFFSVLAFLHHLPAQGRPSTALTEPTTLRKIFAGLSVITISIWLNQEINVKGFVTNYQLRQSTKVESLLESESKKPYHLGLEDLLEQKNYFELTDIRQQLMQVSEYMMGLSLKQKKYYDFVNYLYVLTDRQIQLQLQDDPKNLIFKFRAAAFYSLFRNFEKAEPMYKDLLSVVPNNQYFLIDMGNLKISQGLRPQALPYYQRALELEPNFAQARLFLAIGLVYNEQYQKADLIVQDLLSQNKPEAIDERLINAYLAQKKVDEASKLIQKRNQMIERGQL